MLKEPGTSFTVFAPGDQAFDKLPDWQFDKILDFKNQTKMALTY